MDVVVSVSGETLLKIGVLIMNADCGVIKILAPNGEMVVAHGGFNNVDNSDGSSIVVNAINYFVKKGIHPGELKFQIGEAASGFAYGFDTTHPKYMKSNEQRAYRLASKYGNDVIKTIDRSPRNGGIGFDVPLIAARQAQQMRVQREIPSTIKSRATEDNPNGYGARNAAVVYPR